MRYLAGVPFPKLGLPTVGRQSPASLSEGMQHTIYQWLIAPRRRLRWDSHSSLAATWRRHRRRRSAEVSKGLTVSTAAPLRRNLITPTTLVLAALVAIAFYFLLLRFLYGLGAVANINSGYPWGIWVVVDVIIGTAFGCGGFAMALLVYIFNRGEYHPLMRPALLSGLFGYTLGGFAVIFDLGRYWQAYNLLLPWYAQPNSVMFEVALCVMAYVVVLWIEFSPAFLERWA